MLAGCQADSFPCAREDVIVNERPGDAQGPCLCVDSPSYHHKRGLCQEDWVSSEVLLWAQQCPLIICRHFAGEEVCSLPFDKYLSSPSYGLSIVLGAGDPVAKRRDMAPALPELVETRGWDIDK